MKIRYHEIQKMCKDLGITITDLERQCGFAKGSLCKIEKHEPRKDKMQKLEAAFNKYLQERQESLDSIDTSLFAFGTGKTLNGISFAKNEMLTNYDQDYESEKNVLYDSFCQATPEVKNIVRVALNLDDNFGEE